MRRMLHKWLLSTFFVLIASGMVAQTKLMSTDFSQGLPLSWGQSPANPLHGWTTGATGVGTLVPQTSSAYAMLNSPELQGAVKLITTRLDISSLQNPVLSYWFAQPAATDGNYDHLKVYYRTTLTGAWTLLKSENGAVPFWTHRVIALDQLGATSIQIAFEYNYGSGIGVALDNIYIDDESPCTPPAGLNARNIRANSASLFWSGASVTDYYDLKVSTTPMVDMTATADVYDNMVFVPPYALSGLTATSTYYFYLRAHCDGGDISDWSDQGTFTTACDATALPYTMNFNGCVGSSCWNYFLTMSGGDVTSSSAGYTPSCSNDVLNLKSLFEPSEDYSSPLIIRSVAATPELNVASLTNYQVTFKATATTTGAVLHVGLMSNPTDITTFEELGEYSVVAPNVTEEFILPFAASTLSGKHVAFVVDGADGVSSEFTIDDVEIDITPLCPKVSMLRSPIVKHNEVTLSWVSNNASLWNVKVSTTPMTDMTETADAFDAQTSTNPMVVTGLTPNTLYYVYVQNNCGTDGTGEWSNVYSFTTNCLPINAWPYISNFNDVNHNGFPDCWFRPSMYNSYPKVVNATGDMSPGALHFQSDGYRYSYAVTPAMGSSLNSLQLNFTLNTRWTPDNGVFEVGVMSNPADTSTFELVKRIVLTSIGVKSFEVPLINVSLQGENNYIAFRQLSEVPADGYYYIDDIVIDSLPACVFPLDIRTELLTAPRTIIKWSSVLGETQWNVKVSDAQLAVPATDMANVLTTTLSTDSLVLSNLSVGATYYMYIQSICDNENSTWTMHSFTVPCAGIEMLPFTETFTGFSVGQYPPCWTVGAGSPNIVLFQNYTNTTLESGALQMYLSYGSQQSMFILPTFNVPNHTPSDLQMSFAYSGSYGTIGQAFYIGVINTPADMSSFTILDTIYITEVDTYHMAHEISLANYTGDGRLIAVLADYNTTGNGGTLYVDDIRVELIPSCKRPLEVTIESLADTQLDLAWLPRASEQSWEIAYGNVGFDIANAQYITTTQPSYQLTGLSPLTTYQLFIRSSCGSNDVSAWSDPMVFTTTKTPDQLPLYIDFEDPTDNVKWTLANGVQMNKWVIGTDTALNGQYSMYISNGTGEEAANNYIGETSHVMAYRTIAFQPGIYSLSFDWKGNGDTNNDFVYVALVESRKDIVAGREYIGDYSTKMPQEWDYDLTGGKPLRNQLEWTRHKNIFSIDEAKVYNLVFYWRNDYYSQSQPPFAMDNLVLTMLSCAPAIELEAVAIDTAVTLTWNNSLNAPKFDVRISTTPLELEPFDDTTLGDVYNDTAFTNTYTFSHLLPVHSYYAYVRTNCADSTREEWTSVQFKTECSTVKQLPYVENFDTYGVGINAMPTCWFKDQPSAYYPSINSNNHSREGVGSLYIYVYNSVAMASSPIIDAAPMNNLLVSFYASTTSAGQKLEVGTVTDPYDINTFVAVDTITISLDNEWLYYEIDMSEYSGNARQIAFLAGRVSPAYIYIDDVKIIENRACTTPDNLTVSEVNINTARLIWSTGHNEETFTLKYATTPFDPETSVNANIIEVTDIQDLYYSFNGLTEGTTYYYAMQTDCGSYWTPLESFTTRCTAASVPYEENFVGQLSGADVIPTCWNVKETMLGWVVRNPRPGIYEGNYCNNDTLGFKIEAIYNPTTLDGIQQYNLINVSASLPSFTDDLRTLYLTITAFANNGVDGKLKVGVLENVADLSSFELISTIDLTTTCKEHIVSFAPYHSASGIITIMLDEQNTECTITNVKVLQAEDCQPATQLYVTDITDNAATIHWAPLSANDTLWHIQVVDVPATADDLVTITDFVVDTIIQATQLALTNLVSQTTYTYFARPVCNGTDGPHFPEVRAFVTPCPVASLPFNETFIDMDPITGLPICWSTAVGAYSDIITSVPFSETPSRWEVRNNGNGIVGSHFVVNVYSGYNNQTYSPINTEEWLMSPVVSIDSTTMLSFTLARTAKNGAGTPSMTGWWNQYDDRFYVIISTDGGISWDADNAVVWGNNNPYMGGGNFNYSFTAISTTGTNYTIDLSRYAGNDVIVGFYAESTQEDYDLDLHVGNIMMVNLPKLNVSASICQGNSYSGNGFNIPASSNEEVGKYSYTRTTAAADTVVILSLEVLPNSVTSFQATICQGDVYAANGFNETMSGLYHQYLTSAIGCDSIVELYLMVMSDTTFLEERTICASELPYSWNGQTLTAAGTHTAGVPSSLGCDSTVLLTLTVLAETHTTDYLELAFEELPYTYNDTIFGVDTKLGASAHVFHYTDANGCDSTHTLTLVVKEPVGTVEVENADMSLYPNPVKRDGQVMVDGDFTEAEIDGMVVDVYNSLGQVVKTIRPTSIPVSINGFDASGIYIVRITTSENRVVYGKVVVR